MRGRLAALLQAAIVASSLVSTGLVLPATAFAGTTANTLTLTSSAASVAKGASVTFTVAIAPTAAAGVVTILDGATTLGTCTLSKGKCTLATTTLAAGAHAIVASYPGNTTYAPSTSGTLIQSVTSAFRGSIAAGTTSKTGAASLAVGIPTGTLAGDLLVAAITVTGGTGATITPPAGWTRIGTDVANGTALRQAIFWKVRAGTDGTTYPFTFGASTSRASGVIVAVNGGAAETPVAAGQANASSTTVATPALTLPAARIAIPLLFAGTAINTTVGTVGTGYTKGAGVASSGSAPLTTTGSAYGTFTLRSSVAASSIAMGVAALNIGHTVAVSAAPGVTVARILTGTATTNAGQTASFGVRVDPTSATGTVSIVEGASVVTTCSLASGACTASTAALATGTHSLVARYDGDANWLASSSSTFAQTTAGSTTTTTVTGPTTAAWGSPVALTIEVKTSDGATPTAAVALSDGTRPLAPCTLTDGLCTVTLSDLSVGTRVIVASYPGDAGHAGSTGSLTIAVSRAGSTTTLTVTPAAPTWGDQIVLGASVSPAGATGTVAFSDGSTALGTCSLTTGGSCTRTLSGLLPGPHALIARYLGDANLLPGASTTTGTTVAKASATVTLRTSPNPAAAGAPITYTISLTTGDGSLATGSVSVSDGATTVATCSLTSGGSCTVTSPALAVGDHGLVARWAGDATHLAAASSTLVQTVSLIPTTTTLTVAPLAISYGGVVTASIAVSPTATGKVTIVDGLETVGTCDLSAGGCTTAVRWLHAGSHGLTAFYPGDATRDASHSATAGVSVAQATSATSLVLDATSATHGAPVVATISVTSGDGSLSDGTALLRVDGAGPTSCALVHGACTITLPTLAVGDHLLVASFAGDADRTTSTSASVALRIDPAPTLVTLLTDVNPARYGDEVPLTVFVTSPDGTPTGTVAISDGTTPLGSCALSDGTCAFVVGGLAVGFHPLVATYAGDPGHLGGPSDPLFLTVDRAVGVVILGSGTNPSTFGASVGFTAIVGPTGATGSVELLEGGTSLGSCTLSDGTCTIATAALGAGTHGLVARYLGDGRTSEASSATLVQEVGRAATTTRIVASTDGSVVGRPVTFTVTLSPAGATGYVTLVDGPTTVHTCALAGGTCSWTTSGLAVGNHPVRAEYGGDGNFLGSSDGTSVVVRRVPTVTTFLLAGSAVDFGSVAPFSVSVTTADGSGPTGFVSIREGALVVGSCTLTDGTCAGTLRLGAGDHSLVAVYGGDDLRATSTSAAATQTVSRGTTTTTIAVAPTSTWGQTVSISVAVSTGDGGTAAGTVAISDGTTGIGSCDLAGGSCTFSTADLDGGNHTLVASFAGDADRNGSASAAAPLQVARIATTTTVGVNRSSVNFGANVTISVSVSPATATGTVSISDGTAELTTCTLVSGACSLSVNYLTGGSHTIGATYLGDANRAPSMAATTAAVTVAKVASSTTVSSNVASAGWGSMVTFTAIVSPATVLSGTISFSDGTTGIGSCSITTGSGCTLSTDALTVGAHPITASYSGDASRNASSSAVYSQTIVKATTTTTVTGAPTSSVWGASATFTISVAPASATGIVELSDGTSRVGTCTLAAGSCTISSAALPAGTRSLVARYPGDTSRAAGVSTALGYVVAKLGSTTSLTLDRTTGAYGDAIAATATVAMSDGTTPVGTIAFSDGTAPLGTCSLTTGGTCSIAVSGLTAGAHALVARYLGDANRAATASDAIATTISRAATTTTLTPSATSLAYASPLTIVVRATSAGSGGTPTGSVAISDGTIPLGTCSLTSGGACSISTSALTTGDHLLLATYLGDANRAGGDSGAVAVTITRAPTTVTVTTTPASATVGDTVTITGTVGAIGTGTAGTIQLFDAGVSLGTCSITTGTSCSIATAALLPGSHPLTAAYSGDANRQASVSATATFIVNKLPSATSLLGNLSSLTYGTPITLTATVTPASVTGTVAFSDGTTPLGSCTLAGATCELVVPALSAGVRTIVAIFSGDADRAPSTSPAISVAVATAASSVTLAVAPESTTYGSPVTFTTSVTSADGWLPTGRVAFSDGTLPVGSCTLDGSGGCTLTTTSLPAGAHALVARYLGDGNRAPSVSASVAQTTAKAATTAAIATSAATLAFGNPLLITVSAATTDGSSTPAGIVSISDGSATVGTCSLTTGGSCTVTTSTLAVGDHALVARYAGDANRLPSASDPLAQTIVKATTSLGLATSLTPSTFGSAITLTATIAPAGATGLVSFSDGTTGIGTCSLTTGGSCTLTTATLGAGSHALRATYGGDASRFGSDSSVLTQVVDVASSTTTLTSSANPVAWGTTIVLRAAVNGTATGTVSFSDGSTPIGTCSLTTGGSCTLSTNALDAGSHALTATYGGDANRTGSVSGTVTQSIARATTTTTVSSSLAPSSYGAAVTWTATVSPASATGTVSFSDGSVFLGTCSITTGGACSITRNDLTAATHPITALYAGDTNRLSSTSVAFSQVVAKATATATIFSSLNPSTVGALVTFTASVTSADGWTPTGIISFSDGTTTVGTCALAAGGTCSIASASLSAGAHPIVAKYAGDANRLAASSASAGQQVDRAATTVTLASNLNPSVYPASVTFTIGVTAAAEAGLPTGTVSLSDGAATVGSCSLSSGTCTITTAALAAGDHPLVARYAGDASRLPGASTVLNQTVTKSVTATTLSASANPAAWGASVTWTIAVSPTAATGLVSLSDGGATVGTCSLTSGGACTIASNALSVGDHPLVARYGGDANRTASDSTTLTQTIVRATTTTTVTTSGATAAWGTTVTFTGSVSSAAVGGTISFSDGSTGIGSCTIATGTSCTVATSALDAGSHAITAAYSGDGNRLPSTSATLTQTITRATTTTTLVSSASSTTYGKNVLLTVTVSPSSATGLVALSDGTAFLGLCLLTGGTCAISTSALAVGTHQLSAKYPGDANRASSASGNTVQSIAKAPTTLTLAASAAESVYGSTITLTIGATSDSGGTPTGTVTITDGTATVATCTLVSGSCSLPVANLGAGTHLLGATYAGDTNRALATAEPVAHTVSLAPTTTTLVTSPNPAGLASVVTMTGSIAAVGIATGGTMTFFEGGTILGTCSITIGTGCSMTTDTLARGDHTLTAAYSGDANRQASVSPATVQTITTATTTTTLVPTPARVTYGDQVALAASVVSPVPGATGTITFSEGATTLGSCSLTDGGGCAIGGIMLASGSHPLVATYAGDSEHLGSASATVAFIVDRLPTTATIAADLTSATYGDLVTVTVGVPTLGATGTVALSDGTIALGSCTLAAGTCTIATRAIPAGSRSLVARYLGDSDRAPSASDPFLVTVAKAAATVAFSGTPESTTYGETMTFTASVTSADGGTPTGSISLLDGAASVGTCSLTSGGACTIAISTLTGGTHTLVARYSGDANRLGVDSASLARTVARITTGATLGVSATSVTYGTSLIFTVAVAAAAGGGTPGGTVSLSDGAATAGSCSLTSGGACTITTSALTGGDHTLVARYLGDVNRLPSDSGSVSVSIARVASTTAITASKTSITWGQSVTLTATVTPAAATGTITFVDGTTGIGTCTLSGGTCNTMLTPPFGGDRAFVAVYGGDANRIESTSGSTPVTVTKIATTTTLAASANPAQYGTALILTATVGQTGSGVPTGSVSFTDNSAGIGSCTLAAGACTLTLPADLALGSHAIVATYGGDTGRTGSVSGTLAQSVVKATTTTAISTSGSPVTYGSAVTVTATVAPAAASGTVTFSDGTAFAGSCTLSGGSCSIVLSGLSAGTHPLVARYGGDGFRNASASASLSQVVDLVNSWTSLVPSTTSATYGSAIDLAITVSTANGSVPTGTASVSDGTATVGTCTLSGGACILTSAGLSAGTHTLVAKYGGDIGRTASASSAVTVTIAQDMTVTTISAPASSTYGQPVAFGIAVSSAVGSVVAGTVAVSDGTSPLGTCTLSSGACTFTTATLAAGNHAIVARYLGDANRLPSESAVAPILIELGVTSTTLTTDLNPIGFGRTLRLTASVTAAQGIPAGTVTFLDGVDAIGSCELSAGGCSITSSTLAVGDHQLAASYSGGGAYGPSGSTTLVQTVRSTGSTAVLTSDPTSATYGATITFRTVVTTDDASAPTGTITLLDGLTTVGTCTVAAGECSIPTATLGAGTRRLIATYGGDGFVAPSSSGSVTVTIAQRASTVTIGSSANPAVYGATVTLTMTVDGPAAASGSVAVSDGTTGIGSCTLTNLSCTLRITTFAAGDHPLTARYVGDANRLPATGSLTQVVTKLTTTTTATISASPQIYGTGSLSITISRAAATGTVTILDNSAGIGTCTLASAACTFSTAGLALGSHSLVARYDGDATNAGSSSAAISLSVVPGVHGATTATVSAGTAFTIARPAAAIVGDLLAIAVTEQSAGITVTAPADWTRVGFGQTTAGALRQVVFVKPFVAGDATSWTFTLSAATKASAVLLAVGGVSTTTPPADAFATAANDTTNQASTATPALALSSSRSGIVVLFVGVNAPATASSAGTGYTLVSGGSVKTGTGGEATMSAVSGYVTTSSVAASSIGYTGGKDVGIGQTLFLAIP